MKLFQHKKEEKRVPQHNGPLIKQYPSPSGRCVRKVKSDKWRQKRSEAKETRNVGTDCNNQKEESTMSNTNNSSTSPGRPKRDWAPQHNGGPLVKSGPTYGQRRSTNKNGRYRKKRSDAGKPRKIEAYWEVL